MLKKSAIGVLALSAALVSCNKDNPGDNSLVQAENVDEMKVPDDFNWETSKTLMADVSILDLEGNPMPNIRVDIYSAEPTEGGKLISSAFTNAAGEFEQPFKVATSQKEVLLLANVLAFENRITISTEGERAVADFGGIPAPRVFKKDSDAGGAPVQAASYTQFGDGVFYLDPYNTFGVPSGMGFDAIPNSVMMDLAAALPESQSVPCTPSRAPLVGEGVSTEVVTQSQTDVFVTFMGEGAGFKNALAFHYYPKNAPPASIGAIDSVFVIFPNASTGNNNALQPGDKVKLGNFPANTVISWVLFQNEWDNQADEVIDLPGRSTFFAIDNFNADQGNNCGDPTFDRHMVAFEENINGNDVVIFGFEDLNLPGGDKDYNDCVWYASGDVVPCKKAPALVSKIDSDQDGVDDSYDDFPNDPTRACIICYDGTVAFEDLWPAKGDYDFNDAVIAYKGQHVINAQGELIDIDMDYTLRAYGAGFNNGFGFMFGDEATSTDVNMVSGTVLTSGNIVTDGNGTEANPPAGANQGKGAVIIAIDELKKFYSLDIAGGPFFNTKVGGGQGNDVTANITVLMNAGIPMSDVGLPPYNPFLFIDQDRSREVHLADMMPTPQVNTALFGTMADDSDPGNGRFYKTASPNNLPWGLNIHYSFDYPIEKVPITDAYNFFDDWAMSNGGSFTDWYLDKPGYRNGANIY